MRKVKHLFPRRSLGWLSSGHLTTINWGRLVSERFMVTSYMDRFSMLAGALFALLALTSFIGGCGRIGLQVWASRWEISYLIVLSVAIAVSVVDMLLESRKSFLTDFMQLLLFAPLLALPYLPFRFISLPNEPPPVGKVTTSEPVVDDLDTD
jgi:hypothetical protein